VQQLWWQPRATRLQTQDLRILLPAPWSPAFCLVVFLGLAGGVSGMLLASRGYWYVWPYCLMQRGMNANQSSDMLADSYLGFALACVGWLALILLAVQLLLSHQDVKVR